MNWLLALFVYLGIGLTICGWELAWHWREMMTPLDEEDARNMQHVGRMGLVVTLFLVVAVMWPLVLWGAFDDAKE